MARLADRAWHPAVNPIRLPSRFAGSFPNGLEVTVWNHPLAPASFIAPKPGRFFGLDLHFRGKNTAAYDELRMRLESEIAALSAMAGQESADGTTLLAQPDGVSDVERDQKHPHVGLAVAVKNLLTPGQQAKLWENQALHQGRQVAQGLRSDGFTRGWMG